MALRLHGNLLSEVTSNHQSNNSSSLQALPNTLLSEYWWMLGIEY
jgi:hypothetical protein